jgi:glutathione S-transferase
MLAHSNQTLNTTVVECKHAFKLKHFAMESRLILYLTRGSPPCRAVLQLCRMLELNVELKKVNFQDKEQTSEEFVKLNPAKEVPVLIDGDFVLSESRAILAYLVNSKRPGSELYPNDAKKRAIVDQRLYYDATTFFPNHSVVVVSDKSVEFYDGNRFTSPSSPAVCDLRRCQECD